MGPVAEPGRRDRDGARCRLDRLVGDAGREDLCHRAMMCRADDDEVCLEALRGVVQRATRRSASHDPKAHATVVLDRSPRRGQGILSLLTETGDEAAARAVKRIDDA